MQTFTKNRRFAENADGVHLIPSGLDVAICGDACDIGSEEGMEDMRETKKRTVTCDGCIDMIEACRGVRVKRRDPDDGLDW